LVLGFRGGRNPVRRLIWGPPGPDFLGARRTASELPAVLGARTTGALLALASSQVVPSPKVVG
jgi:hypothetical protein